MKGRTRGTERNCNTITYLHAVFLAFWIELLGRKLFSFLFLFSHLNDTYFVQHSIVLTKHFMIIVCSKTLILRLKSLFHNYSNTDFCFKIYKKHILQFSLK